MKHGKKLKTAIILLINFALIASVVLLITTSKGFTTKGPEIDDVKYVTEVQASVDGGPFTAVTLPHSFNKLKPGTPVVITGEITPQYDDSIYVKTVYSPAKIYLDGKLVFEFGLKSNYPEYMSDPATEIHIIETQGTGKTMKLRMEFSSPTARDTLIVHPPLCGTSKELILERYHELGPSFTISLVQMICGVLMVFVSFCICFIDKKGITFLWLGLFALTSGMWSFGENNFTGIVSKNSVLLYLFSFIGMFTFIIPLIKFTREIVDFEKEKLLFSMEIFYTVAATVALALQMLGIIPCSKSVYFFHIVLPIALIIITVLTIHEYVKNKTKSSKRYILPICILTCSAIIELLNYKFHFTPKFSSIFQTGILIFLLVMGITAGFYLKDSVNLKQKQKQLKFEKGLIDIQIKENKNRSLQLAEKEQILSHQRHDLRHQLAVIKDLAGEDNPKLQDYINSLIADIPQSKKQLCENTAVNAVVAYYTSLAEENSIEITVKIEVPEKNKEISDESLCAIFGNLLENAVEACKRMEDGKKFIKLSSSVRYNLLTITMDNSFSGTINTKEGRFLSSKRDGFGIGIASIQSIAKKENGNAVFTTENNVFLSSVYVKL